MNESNTDDTSATAKADENRLRQLFGNLFRNAIEHGGNDVTITVGDLDDGFYVADNGSGIPDEERDQVFEAGHTSAETGTGLGLSIVKEIADAHDWTVSATESSEGGARFEIIGVQSMLTVGILTGENSDRQYQRLGFLRLQLQEDVNGRQMWG